MKLAVKNGSLELIEYPRHSSLADLAEAVESFLSSHNKTKVQCRLCGQCCHRAPVLGLDIQRMAGEDGMCNREWADARLMPLPPVPDVAARRKGIDELRVQTGLAQREAAALYECNHSEPLSFLHDERDRCGYQRDNLCSIYARRPYICRLYLCRFGDRLQALQEMIVTQGTWHAYALLGAAPAEAIAHNPFAGASSFGDVLLEQFEYGLEKALEELFSYF